MDYRGIKRIGGSGYENEFVIVRRRKKGAYAFFLFLLIFGGGVYLIAHTVFRALFFESVRASLFILF